MWKEIDSAGRAGGEVPRMAGRHRRHAAGDAETPTDDGAWLILVRDRGVLDFPPAPVANRWVRVLRRATGATVAAVSLHDDSRRLVTRAAATDAWTTRAEPLASSESLESYLRGLSGPATGLTYYAQASVTMDGVVL